VYHTQSYCFGLTKILGERLQKKAPTSALVFYKFYGINTRLARSFCIHVKFLLNLGRAIKAKYVTLPARVVGRKQGHVIWVYTLEVKKGGKYRQVWSFEEQQEIYRGGK
jgi:hypothetical protein